LSDLKELNETAPRFMGSHSVISNKSRLHTKKKHIRTIKTQKSCVTNKNAWVCLFELKR